MAAERCWPDRADWYARAVLGRDLPDGGTETGEIDDYFTGDRPQREDFAPLPEGWRILQFTVQPTPRTA